MNERMKRMIWLYSFHAFFRFPFYAPALLSKDVPESFRVVGSRAFGVERFTLFSFNEMYTGK